MPLSIRVPVLRRGERVSPEQWVRGSMTPRRLVNRARMVLTSADGVAGEAIRTTVGASRPTVSRRLDRYAAEGVAGLQADRPRSGRSKQLGPAAEACIIARTLNSPPRNRAGRLTHDYKRHGTTTLFRRSMSPRALSITTASRVIERRNEAPQVFAEIAQGGDVTG